MKGTKPDLNEADTRVLSRVPFLTGLPQAELQHLALTLKIRRFAPGEVLFREGEHGDFFYIVRRGQVEIIKGMDRPAERRLALRGPGEFVGEMSLINQEGLRTASVRASGPVSLWELSRREFDALLHRQPLLAYEMVRVLSERLNVAHNDSIRDLEAKNRQLTEAYEALQAAQAQIIEKERLERELQVAHDIQMSILPHTLPVLEGFNFGMRLLPARSVGGDFFGFIPLDTDRLGIMIGDVTDKGVPAAIFMAQVHAYLTAEAEQDKSPSQVLQDVNTHLLRKEAGGLFVTVLYGVLDRRQGKFSYARAGHDLPILHVRGSRAVMAARETGQPLGLFDRPLLDEQTLDLPQGSTLLLYTDGITEQRSPGGEFFGTRQLLAAMEAGAGRNARQLCSHLLATVQGYLGAAAQDDDLTLLVVQACPV